MRDWIVGFWTDEARFIALMRGAAVAFAGLVHSGAIDLGTIGWWGGLIAPGLAMAFPAGEKNRP